MVLLLQDLLRRGSCPSCPPPPPESAAPELCTFTSQETDELLSNAKLIPMSEIKIKDVRLKRCIMRRLILRHLHHMKIDSLDNSSERLSPRYLPIDDIADRIRMTMCGRDLEDR